MAAVHRTVRHQPDTLSCELIDDRQDTERASIGKLVAHEVGGPTLVRPRSRLLRNALPASDLLPFNATHLQGLFVVEPIDAFGIHGPALPPQQHRKPAISVTNMGGGSQLAQPKPKRFLQGPAAAVTHRAP